MILSRGGAIGVEHLPPATAAGDDPGTRDAMLAALVRDWTEAQIDSRGEPKDLYARLLNLVEPPLIAEVLARHRGQFLSSARTLGLHRVTLRRKAAQYGLDAEPGQRPPREDG